MFPIQIAFENDRRIPLYLQLKNKLALDISGGIIPEGVRLPGKRTAAQALGISQNTVDSAYQMLAAEGYITAKPRSGFVVNRVDALSALPAPELPAYYDAEPPIHAADFSTGSISTGLFPLKTWGSLFRDIAANRPDLLNQGEAQGDYDLRRCIASYLTLSRGVSCTPAQVVVGAGMEYLLSLLCLLFPKHSIGVEDPGYTRTAKVFASHGLAVKHIKLDTAGICPHSLREQAPDMLYITPSHQFPTGITTPVWRRAELLSWVREQEGRYLIEDDYDSEFRFDGRPLPCLQGMDRGEQVVYIGTFSRTVAPAVRVAYLILPFHLADRLKAELGFFSSTVSRLEQQTLCRFMSEGHFERSLRRMKNQYRQRRDLFIAGLSEGLRGTNFELESTHTGLSFVLHLPDISDEPNLLAHLKNHGVFSRGIKEYLACPDNAPPGGSRLVLGFGALDKESLADKAAALCRTIRSF